MLIPILRSTIFSILITLPVFADQVLFSDMVLNRSEQKYYKKFENRPYSGEVHATEDSPIHGRFENGYRDGTWNFFHQNGLIKQTGLYQENKKTGFWKEFNDQGILLSELHYDDGELTNGEIIMLDYKKRKEAEYVFANGKELTKLEYVYGFNGELLCKIFYRNKTEISREIFSYYYSDNTLKSLRTYRAASVDMLSEINNAHDIDDVFEEFGTLHGEYIYYQKDGTVSLKGQFIDGYLEGVLERYYETGELEFKETRTSGWPHGKRERFYLDGTLAEIDEFIYGTLHKNGEPAEGTYEHLFYDDGPIRRTINYVAGIQHGVERIYKLDGSIDAEYFYEYGKIAEK